MNEIPPEIKKLLEERTRLRKQGKFREGDELRKRIEAAGFLLADQKNGITVLSPAKQEGPPKTNFLVMFGSGEIAPSAVKIHERVFKEMGKDEIRIAIVSTPAGFQPNVEIVYRDIETFFLSHLKNYHPQVSLVFANNREDANNEQLLKPLKTADYIFTGPGSPTYAVKHLKGSLLYETILGRVSEGVTLSCASAAAIAFSRHALPVYEIYKVGTHLYWEEGLDLYAKFFQPLTLVPHFNNQEGGRKTDTSHCFMGKERFEKLMKLLPAEEPVWGIDEHTALIYNFQTKETLTLGKGKVYRLR